MSASPSEVREWAAANGHTTGARGRFSAELIEAFNKGKRGAKRYALPSAK